MKKNFFKSFYFISCSLLAIIWFIFLVKMLSSTITFNDVRVGFVVGWGAVAFVLSFIPVLYILLFSYWYIKKWRTTNNLIYVLACLLIAVISFIWSSNYISDSVERNKYLEKVNIMQELPRLQNT